MGNSCSVEINMEVNNIIWIDPEVDNNEITQYAKELQSTQLWKVKLFKLINEAIDYLKTIKFRETKVIVSGGLYSEFVKFLKKNLESIYVAPKIIVYTSDPKKFKETNQDYKNSSNIFYRFGGVTNTFEKLKSFIKNERYDILEMENKPQKMKEKGANNLMFEYIDTKEKLMLPMMFKSLIEPISNDSVKKFTNLLTEAYINENDDLKSILHSLEPMTNIPIEILCKYYARIYTVSSNFQNDIPKIIRKNLVKVILPFIQTLYEGLKLRSLPLYTDEFLYIGCLLPDKDMNTIKDNFNKKVKHLPSSIMFSKNFLTFTKDRTVAENFLDAENKPVDCSKVLFVLEKEDNLSYGSSTYCDIEKISYFSDQKEVLFFPFSPFEVRNIKKVYLNREDIYEIKLLYLDRYLDFIENDKNLIMEGEDLPDSEFKRQICDYGLINKDKNENIKKNQLYIAYKKYEEEIKLKNYDLKETEVVENNEENEKESLKTKEIEKEILKTKEIEKEILNTKENEKEILKTKENEKESLKTKENEKEDEYNFDLGRIDERGIKENTGYILIYPDDLNKDIQIINSFENIKREEKSELKNVDFKYMNEKEIKDSIQIKLNDSKINFTYTYRFEKPGIFKIEYIFKKCLTKTNHLFYNCNKITHLYLPILETKNVINMNSMFSGCNALKVLSITNFDTENVVEMQNLFKDCLGLTNLNLSNFKTRNVTNMVRMFFNCKSLIILDLSNFNTQNVTNMSEMFFGCSSLISLDVSNFNTQNVINMIGMFNGCTNLKSINLSKFNTQNVNNMYCMFCGCESLRSLNLSNFKTQNVTNMYSMFLNCKSLRSLDLSNFNSCNVTEMNWMFNGCESLKKSSIITKDKTIIKFFETQRVFIFHKKY